MRHLDPFDDLPDRDPCAPQDDPPDLVQQIIDECRRIVPPDDDPPMHPADCDCDRCTVADLDCGPFPERDDYRDCIDPRTGKLID